MKESTQPSGKEISDFFAGKAAAEILLPNLKKKIREIQADGKTAWVGVGPCSAFIGFSENGASSPYLMNTKSVPYPPSMDSEKASVAFRNGIWCVLNKELQIKSSRYMFREVA